MTLPHALLASAQRLLLRAAEELPAQPVPDSSDPLINLAYAALLLVVAMGLLALEFFVVSGGLIAIAAIACGAGAAWFAFAAGSLAGWTMVLALPLIAMLVLRWGVRRVQDSSMAVQTAITENAGYGHAASEKGVSLGAVGTLTTEAFPTGRARFAGGTLDVMVRGANLPPGASVVVTAIEGPTIYVTAVPTPPSTQSP